MIEPVREHFLAQGRPEAIVLGTGIYDLIAEYALPLLKVVRWATALDVPPTIPAVHEEPPEKTERRRRLFGLSGATLSLASPPSPDLSTSTLSLASPLASTFTLFSGAASPTPSLESVTILDEAPLSMKPGGLALVVPGSLPAGAPESPGASTPTSTVSSRFRDAGLTVQETRHRKRLLHRARTLQRYKLVLPPLNSYRNTAKEATMRWQAAHKLQTMYRGFQSRAMWRRVQHRMRSRRTQDEHLAEKRAALEAIRQYEKRMAAMLQARFKGWLWRARMKQMVIGSIEIQRIARGFLGKKTRRDLERRLLEGLPVDVMLDRGVTVSGVPLILQVRRCGLSFKFEGHDLEKCIVYVGYVYSAQTLELLTAFNPRPPTLEEIEADPRLEHLPDKSIKPFEHDRILQEVLLPNLALTEPIDALPEELRREDLRRTLVVQLFREARGPSIQARGGHEEDGRWLRDQSRAIEVLSRVRERQARREANAPILTRGQKAEKRLRESKHGKLLLRSDQESSEAHTRGRLVAALQPDLSFDNLKFHRKPKPPQRWVPSSKKSQKKTDARRMEELNNELDALFDRKTKSTILK